MRTEGEPPCGGPPCGLGGFQRGEGGTGFALQAGGLGLVVGGGPGEEAQQAGGVALAGGFKDRGQVGALLDVLGAPAQDGGEYRGRLLRRRVTSGGIIGYNDSAGRSA